MKIKEELIKVALNHITTSLEELSADVVRDKIEKNIIVELIDIIPHKDNTPLHKKYTITFYECNKLMYTVSYTMRVKELVDIQIT